MEERKIFKTLVTIEGGVVEPFATIAHDNKLWIVPFWLDQRGLKQTRPGRLIRMDLLRHSKTSGPMGEDFVLNEPVPKSLFDAEPWTQQGSKFEVLESPEIWFELPAGKEK